MAQTVRSKEDHGIIPEKSTIRKVISKRIDNHWGEINSK